MEFLLSSNTQHGFLINFELSTMSKKDSFNLYCENKIFIKFYSSNFFLLIYKKKRWHGIFFGLPSLNLIRKTGVKLKIFSKNTSGILVIIGNLQTFKQIKKKVLIMGDNRQISKNFVEFDKLLCYLIDRKKKASFISL